MRQGLITLIYKNKGNHTDLKNWRPISLLNIDYKILSKIVTNRIKQTLGNIINKQQTCGEKGRNISNNILSIKSILDYMDQKNIDGALVLIDMEKTFDRVETNFVIKILEKFGFGASLIKWI
jgi:ABC-type enterochelin transport system substrate-binding protein